MNEHAELLVDLTKFYHNISLGRLSRLLAQASTILSCDRYLVHSVVFSKKVVSIGHGSSVSRSIVLSVCIQKPLDTKILTVAQGGGIRGLPLPIGFPPMPGREFIICPAGRGLCCIPTYEDISSITIQN